jgi:predicted Zn finger-like uncharacterized protein
MKVQCGQCPAKYAIADERIHGKRVRIRCKRCGAAIVIDGKVDPPHITSEPAAQAASDSIPPSTPRPEAKTILGGLEAPTHLFDRKPLPQSSPPPRPVANRSATPAGGLARAGMPPPGRGFTEPPAALNGKASWRVAMTENDLRWMTTGEVLEAYRAGVVKPETFVLREGMSHWQTLLEVDELADALGEGEASALLNGKASAEESDAPPSVPPPRKPGSGKRPALLDPEDSESLNAKMTKLGLGLDLKPQSPSILESDDEAAEHTRGNAGAHLDESFLTLPFTDAEPVESVPSPKVNVPDLGALPLPSPNPPAAALDAEPPVFARPDAAGAGPLPLTPHTTPHSAPQPELPPFAGSAPSSGSLWPWLIAVVVVAAVVAAAVVFSR